MAHGKSLRSDSSLSRSHTVDMEMMTVGSSSGGGASGYWHSGGGAGGDRGMGDHDDNTMLEVMLDVHMDSVVLRGVNQPPGSGGSGADSDPLSLWASTNNSTTFSGPISSTESIGDELWQHEATLLSDGLEKKPSLRSSMRRSGSARLKQLTSGIGKLSRNSSSARVKSVAFSAAAASGEGGHGGEPRMTRSVSSAEHALEGLRYINKATITDDQKSKWEEVQKRFDSLKGPDDRLARADFAACIGMKDTKEFAMEMFEALTRRKGLKVESLTKDELYDMWLQVTDQNFDSRMQIFFDLCDKNGDGRITEEEVKEVLMLSAAANKLSRLKEQAEEYAALIMEELDPTDQGYIELYQLETLMNGPVGGFGKEAVLQYSQTLAPQRAPSNFMLYTHKARFFVEENKRRLCIVFLWILAMAGLFTWKFIQYKDRDAFETMGYCLSTAKGAAETLKLNMALILLPVCRNTITWLRSTFLGSIIPFDDNLNFHKVIASGIAVGVLVHGIVHLSCDFPKIASADADLFQRTLGDDFQYKQPDFWYFIRSIEGVTGILMVVLMTIAFCLATTWFRRNIVKLPWPFHNMTGFNAFWYSHHLFVLVYILLIIHSIFLFMSHGWKSKTTWMYLAGPLLLYMGERILRAFRAGRYHVKIIRASLYPGNVLSLQMTKPPGFRYKSGMYMFLKCPAISSFEWHPFSITSAPGDDYLSVHIRTLGDWTKELRRVFQEANESAHQKGLQTKSGNLRVMFDTRSFPRLEIDGPYGAPAQSYKKYDVMLLVGLGIGATPFISILKDMLYTFREESAQSDSSTDLSAGTTGSKPDESPVSKKRRGCTNAYFYWVTREQGSFEWFKNVMNEVEEIDNKQVIEMHNYLTSVYEEGDARSSLIMMVQALQHAKNGIDIVSGTRARTHFARPNWKKVFSRLAATHRGERVGVFYCGPAGLAKELDGLARHYTQKTSTKFVFHKENF